MGIFNVFKKKPKEEFIDIDKDLKAIREYIKGVNSRVKNLDARLKEFQDLRKLELQLLGKKISPQGMKRVIKNQIKIYDKVLKRYQLFRLDTAISGERIKKIAKALKNKAFKYKLDENLLKKLKTDIKWTFDW